MNIQNLFCPSAEAQNDFMQWNENTINRNLTIKRTSNTKKRGTVKQRLRH